MCSNQIWRFSCGYTAAKIGEGILLDHGTGLVIGETAVIGDRVSLMQVSQFVHTSKIFE